MNYSKCVLSDRTKKRATKLGGVDFLVVVTIDDDDDDDDDDDNDDGDILKDGGGCSLFSYLECLVLFYIYCGFPILFYCLLLLFIYVFIIFYYYYYFKVAVCSNTF